MKRMIFFLFAGMLLLAESANAALVWKGKAEQWTQGSGTESQPYLLEKPEHLAYLSQQTAKGADSFSGIWFRQTEDFDMNGSTGYLFTPVGTKSSFQGNYDGNGKKISNIQITYANDLQFCALFAKVSGSTIQNLTIESISYATTSTVTYMASFVADMSDGKLVNCVNNSDLTTNATYTGGLVASMSNSEIRNCTNNANLTTNASYTGGLVAYMSGGEIRNCTNNSNMETNSRYTGGLVAYVTDNCIINHCINKGSISTTTNTSANKYAGGLVGYFYSGAYGYLDCCNTDGEEYYVEGNSYNLTIKNSGNEASIVYVDNHTTNSYSELYVFGIIGSSNDMGSVNCTKVYNTAVITVNANNSYFDFSVYAGGICGCECDVTLYRCYNSGNITSGSKKDMKLYGLSSGYSTITITQCYNTGNLYNYNSSYGYSYGLSDRGTITYSYVVCNMRSKYSYGIKGAPVKHCYYAGEMETSYLSSPIVYNDYGDGEDHDDYSDNSYYLQGDYTGENFGQSLTESLMKGVSFPMSLNHFEDEIYAFDETEINNGYPVLAWQLNSGAEVEIETLCDAAMGSVSGGGTYNIGETATLTATPKDGYAFVGWQDGNKENPRNVEVTGNKTYTATFVKMVYSIRIGQDCSITEE